MAIYQVYAPPEGDDTDRFRFVKDAPAFLAFLMPLVWLLAKRLWMAFLVLLAIVIALRFAEANGAAKIVGVVTGLGILLFTIEARNIESWTLTRRGWRLVGLIEAGNRENAEIRFFHAHAADNGAGDVATPVTPQPAGRAPAPHQAVIGLFPQSSGSNRP